MVTKAISTKIILLSLLAIIMKACNPADEFIEEDVSTNPDMHTSQISLDWAGTYFGVLPCADCEGIETTLSIRYDYTFNLNHIYLGKNDEPISQSGSFKWSEDGQVITLDIDNSDHIPTQYFVGEERLFQLDMDGGRITGELSDHYTLVKVRNPLLGKHFLLHTIFGREIDLTPLTPRSPLPFIQFASDDSQFSGRGDCNNFFGHFRINPEQIISFSDVASTRMACEVMDIDHSYSRLFEHTHRYSLESDTLKFYSTDSKKLAIFILSDS